MVASRVGSDSLTPAPRGDDSVAEDHLLELDLVCVVDGPVEAGESSGALGKVVPVAGEVDRAP